MEPFPDDVADRSTGGPLPVLVAFSVSPMGGDDPDGSVGDAVAACVRAVRDSGLPNETNAMFTNVEGPYDEVMALVRRCVEVCAAVAPRVSLTLKLDHRPGHDGALHAKVAAVEDRLAAGGEAPSGGSGATGG